MSNRAWFCWDDNRLGEKWIPKLQVCPFSTSFYCAGRRDSILSLQKTLKSQLGSSHFCHFKPFPWRIHIFIYLFYFHMFLCFKLAGKYLHLVDLLYFKFVGKYTVPDKDPSLGFQPISKTRVNLPTQLWKNFLHSPLEKVGKVCWDNLRMLSLFWKPFWQLKVPSKQSMFPHTHTTKRVLWMINQPFVPRTIA